MACLRDSIVLWALGGGLALLGGCGDDSGTSGSEGGSSSTGAVTDDTGSITTGSSQTDPVVTGSSSGESSSDGADTTSGSSGDTTAGDTTMGGSTSEGETEGNVCAGLGLRACMAEVDCMGIGGRELMMEGDNVCLGPRTFIECQPIIGCGDAITYACQSEEDSLWEFGSTCTPTGWVDCGPPPPIELLPCPDAGG